MAIQLTDDKLDIEAGPNTPLNSGKCSKRKVLNHLLGFLLAAVGLFTFISKTVPEAGFSNIFAAFASFTEKNPVEVFEIVPPLTVPASAYVSSHLLFDDSDVVDGLTAKYDAPDAFNFTQGFLTLNFSVAASPFPVSAPVVELTVDGVPVWRSSTPLARANTEVYTSTTKNVTDLLTLFEKSSEVVFSVLEDSDAAVSASLELVLFDDSVSAPAEKSSGDVAPVASYFISEGPASLIVPLQKKAVELPASEFSISLPQLNSNITSAKIALFASASKDEVEFYKNDIVLSGDTVSGNGPLRQLNVFVSGVYVGTVSPKPTLYHADKLTTDADRFWSPLAESGAFTGFTYDIDLVAVLPLLWEGPQTLDIALVSPVDSAIDAATIPSAAHSVTKTTNLLAGSWFVSGSLLAWENPLVLSSVGEVVWTNSSQLDSGLYVSPPVVSPWQPKVSNTVVKSIINSIIKSLFEFTLVDNTTASYNIVANSSAVLVLDKSKKEIKIPFGRPGFGYEETKVISAASFVGSTKFKLNVQDAVTNSTVFSKSVRSAYPLSLSEVSRATSKEGTSTTFAANIGIGTETKVDGVAGPSLKIKEIVNLDDNVGATTNVKVEISEPGSLPFSKEVRVINGKVVSSPSSQGGEVEEFQEIEDTMGYF